MSFIMDASRVIWEFNLLKKSCGNINRFMQFSFALIFTNDFDFE